MFPSRLLGCWLCAHGFNFELSLRDAETGEYSFLSKGLNPILGMKIC